jgi:hypothetical protein
MVMPFGLAQFTGNVLSLHQLGAGRPGGHHLRDILGRHLDILNVGRTAPERRCITSRPPETVEAVRQPG